MGNNNNPAGGFNIQNFLETLRNRQAKSPKPRESGAFPGEVDFQKKQQEKQKQEARKREFFRSQSAEIKAVYSKKEREEQQRVEALTRQLKELANAQRKLSEEIKNAVVAEPVIENTGVYQESFLEHLFQMVQLLKRQVENASTWLHVYNSRQKKKGHYWGQVKKSGTKFMMSGERTVSNSIG